MTRAPWGELWLDERVVREGGSGFALEGAGSFEVKGFEQRQEVWRLRGLSEAGSRVSIHGRMVGRQMVATASSHLPLKVNIAGVIPVIFASSVLAIPQTLSTFSDWEWLRTVNRWLGGGHPIYETLFIVLIVLFAFFYVSIVFNADEVAENLRKQGAFVPGIEQPCCASGPFRLGWRGFIRDGSS